MRLQFLIFICLVSSAYSEAYPKGWCKYRKLDGSIVGVVLGTDPTSLLPYDADTEMLIPDNVTTTYVDAEQMPTHFVFKGKFQGIPPNRQRILNLLSLARRWATATGDDPTGEKLVIVDKLKEMSGMFPPE